MTQGHGHKANSVFAPKGAWQSDASASEKCLGYESFGMLLSDQGDHDYRFGFNGKENDNEVHSAVGTSQNFGDRSYDNRIGRWWSLDHLASKYPNVSPFAFAANSPIFVLDEDGNVLKDANGNIIFTRNTSGSPIPTQDLGNGISREFQSVWIYGNDGTKHEAYLTILKQNGATINMYASQGAYDCHGLTKTDNHFFINSGAPIEGLLTADGQGRSTEFSDESSASPGDIAIFRGTLEDGPEAGSTDRIIHTAEFKGKGQYHSKNGGYAKEGDFDRASLEATYGTDVTFTHEQADKTVNLTGGSSPLPGVAEYSADQVAAAVKASQSGGTDQKKRTYHQSKSLRLENH